MPNMSKRPKLLITSLEDFSDEVILNVLRFLNIEDIIRCSQLSKRFRRISQDESLWLKVNLSLRIFNRNYLQVVLNNGCKYLGLYHSRIKNCDNDFILKKPCQLRYLDYSYCQCRDRSKDGVLERILFSCNSLEKLSLARITISSEITNGICVLNGSTLNTLDLCCAKFDQDSFQQIIKACVELTELNLSHTDLVEDDIKFLVHNVSQKIEKLNLSSLQGFLY